MHAYKDLTCCQSRNRSSSEYNDCLATARYNIVACDGNFVLQNYGYMYIRNYIATSFEATNLPGAIKPSAR